MNLNFAQMMCSRLCHDLISPIGAVHSGIELLAESNPEDQAQLLALSQQSAETASRRLVFYRAAFGYSTAMHASGFDKLESLISGFLSSLKIQFTWHDQPEQENAFKGIIEPTAFARVLLNLVLIAAEIGPFGGLLDLKLSYDAASLKLDLNLTGKLVEMRNEIREALQGTLDEKQYSPHTVQALMTHMLLQENGFVIEELYSDKTQMKISLKKDANAQTPMNFDILVG